MGERLDAMTTSTFLKTLLMIFNILFWFSGIFIICIGIWAKVSLYVYTQLSSNNYAFTPYLFIGIGAFIIAAGSLACCCTPKGNPRYLYLYAAVLTLIFLLEFIAGMSFYVKRHKIADGFKQGLNYSLNHYPYQDEKSINYLQSGLRCCGVTQYTDWFNTPFGADNNSVPLSCCSVSASSCVHQNLSNHPDLVDQYIYTQGCHDKVVKFVNGHMAQIGASAFSIAFFNIIGLVLSFYVARYTKQQTYENLDGGN